MLKLYGHAKGRASRSLWMLEEIGMPYEHIPIQPYTESREPAYLLINPNGHIPTLDDDGFILWESLAINLYLAERYAQPPLWPTDLQDRARAYQWTLWAPNEIETRIVSTPKGTPADLTGALSVLEHHLNTRSFLLGNDFTVADLNLASTLREPGESGVADIPTIDLTPFPNITHWLDRCSARPANRRVAALRF